MPRPNLLLLLGLAAAVCGALLHAQVSMGGRIKNFVAPTMNGGKRSVLKGEDGRPIGNNRIELTGPRVETFDENNRSILVIQAKNCIFDQATQIASSSDEINVEAKDKHLSIRGKGWLWYQQQSHLIISNDVTANIGRQMLGAGANVSLANSASSSNTVSTNAVDIRSTEFDYTTNGVTFARNVRVRDDASELTCDRLYAAFEGAGAQIEHIEAHDQVEMKQGTTFATGGLAIYSMRDGLMTLTNAPAWKIEDKEGMGDVLTLNRTNNHVHSAGNVYMRLPGSGVVTNAGLPAKATNFVEITANIFDYDRNLAIYDGNVHAREEDGLIDTERLTIKFGTNQNRIEEIIADANVSIVRGQTRAVGSRATYQIATDLLTLEGSPKWAIGDKAGESGTLAVHPKTQEFDAGAGVHMVLNGGTFGGFHLPSDENRSSDAPMNIFADHLLHKTNSSVFKKDVRVEDAQGKITCQLLTVWTGASNDVSRIAAERDVTILQTNMIATGQLAIYNATNGIVELTGNPKLKTPDRILTAETFFLNRSNNTFRTRGKYRIEVIRPEKLDQTSQTGAVTAPDRGLQSAETEKLAQASEAGAVPSEDGVTNPITGRGSKP